MDGKRTLLAAAIAIVVTLILLWGLTFYGMAEVAWGLVAMVNKTLPASQGEQLFLLSVAMLVLVSLNGWLFTPVGLSIVSVLFDAATAEKRKNDE